MILRIFLVLLALNTVAFVARADAAETDDFRTQDIDVLLEAERFERMNTETDKLMDLADLGTRLLKWRFSSRDHSGEQYASNKVFTDHGIAVAEDGAAVNLTWRF